MFLRIGFQTQLNKQSERMILDPISKSESASPAYPTLLFPTFIGFLLFITGCFVPASVGETCDAIVGDLVISELLVDAAGADSNREWFEIYNASSRPQVLDRLVIRRYSYKATGVCSDESDKPGSTCVSSSECLDSCRLASCSDFCEGPFSEPEDGRLEVDRTVIRGGGVLAPYSYFVLSDGERSDINSDYNYALREHANPSTSTSPALVTESLGDFSQTIGGLGISCGAQIVDEVFYGTREGLPLPTPGQTFSLTGKIAPDSIVNDDPRWWCSGTVELQDEQMGVCSLDENKPMQEQNSCRTDADCASRRECLQQCEDESGQSINCFPTTAMSCVDDLDCSTLNKTGYCSSDEGTSCATDDECRASPGICKGSEPEMECFADCDCDMGCGSCEGEKAAKCQEVFISKCEPNTCTGYVANNFGTPGIANSVCPFVAYDTCMEQDDERDIQFPNPGDLILSELFADPAATDDFPTNSDENREWLELYVHSDSPLDLNGLAVVFTKMNDDGGTSSRTATIRVPECLTGYPGQYLVLGQSSDLELNGGVDVDGVLEDLDIFNNEELKVELVLHGTIVIDSAMVPKSTAGKSSALSPGPIEPTSNDTVDAFCKSEASGVFGGGGTPGSTNACTAPVGCLEGEASRLIESPAADELVISELLFNPSGSDGDKEWIELFNPTNRALDINGIEIINYVVGADSNVKDAIVGGTNCVTVEAGQYVLIGAIDDPLLNGAIAVDGVADGLSFYNSSPGVVEIRIDGVLVDKAVYPGATDGHSVSLKPDLLRAGDNDSLANFCVSESTGNYDGFGTPGSANLCGPSCDDGSGFRPVNAPGAGGLVVTEIMANPLSSDSGKEWFEVYVLGESSIELNGLKLLAGNGNSTRERSILVEDGRCLTVEPGSYIVVGGDEAGDGFELDANWGASELFYNSGLTFSIETSDGTIVDSVVGPISAGTTSPPKSHILDAGVLGPAENDGSANWCRASSSNPSTLAFYGSPGLANETCP